MARDRWRSHDPRSRSSDAEAGLPLAVTPGTNGEYIPAAPTRSHNDMAHAAMAWTDDAARANALDRRTFLHSAGGVAVVLATINLAACSSTARRAASPRTTTTRVPPPTSGPGGTYRVPEPHDIPACEHALGDQGEFIFDVHTHHVMPNGPWRKNAPDTVQLVLGMIDPACTAPDRLECANRANYLHDLFLASDTTVAMLSDVPNSGPADAPIPFADAVTTQSFAAQLTHGGAGRVLVHNVIAPNFGDLGARLADMETKAHTGKVAAFKVYTAWGPNGVGYSLEDPAIGLPVVQKAHDLGVRVFVAHKGLPLVRFDPAHNRPDDIVAISRIFPDMQFVVFHGAWDKNHRESAYDPNARIGIDTFLRALDVHGVPPNSNVWVDLGTVWREVLRNPTTAAHTLGKLLRRVGEDRVLWGTDAVWYGSPQPQIMAFRAFEITPEFQAAYGYPALTAGVKAKILGLNAARLFGIDAHATRCALASDPLTLARPAAAQLGADGVLASGTRANGPVTRRDMLAWLSRPATVWTPA